MGNLQPHIDHSNQVEKLARQINTVKAFETERLYKIGSISTKSALNLLEKQLKEDAKTLQRTTGEKID